jgi:hypothetical protein
VPVTTTSSITPSLSAAVAVGKVKIEAIAIVEMAANLQPLVVWDKPVFSTLLAPKSSF